MANTGIGFAGLWGLPGREEMWSGRYFSKDSHHNVAITGLCDTETVGAALRDPEVYANQESLKVRVIQEIVVIVVDR